MPSVQGKQNLLRQVDGSATFQFSTAKVISSVTGPIEVSRPRNENPTKVFLNISVRPATNAPTTRESYLESKLQKIITPMINLEQYPCSELQIVVQILEAGERDQFTCMELACAVNSLYLALLDAGISLKASFLSSFCSVNTNAIIMRPNKSELDQSTAHHVAVFSITDGKSDELIYSDSLGKTSEAELFKALNLISTDIDKINDSIRQTVFDAVVKDYIWKF